VLIPVIKTFTQAELLCCAQPTQTNRYQCKKFQNSQS